MTVNITLDYNWSFLSLTPALQTSPLIKYLISGDEAGSANIDMLISSPIIFSKKMSFCSRSYISHLSGFWREHTCEGTQRSGLGRGRGLGGKKQFWIKRGGILDVCLVLCYLELDDPPVRVIWDFGDLPHLEYSTISSTTWYLYLYLYLCLYLYLESHLLLLLIFHSFHSIWSFNSANVKM